MLESNVSSSDSLSNAAGNNDRKKAKLNCIDHIAVAVKSVDAALPLFEDILGFEVKHRRHIVGKKSGMRSIELERNGIRFVLCEGTCPDSQVSQLVTHYGVGVAHIAFEVDNVEDAVSALQSQGMEFDTNIIRGPGLIQVFSSRSSDTGLSFEFIHRDNVDGFCDENIQELFLQIEKADTF